MISGFGVYVAFLTPAAGSSGALGFRGCFFEEEKDKAPGKQALIPSDLPGMENSNMSLSIKRSNESCLVDKGGVPSLVFGPGPLP